MENVDAWRLGDALWFGFFTGGNAEKNKRESQGMQALRFLCLLL